MNDRMQTVVILGVVGLAWVFKEQLLAFLNPTVSGQVTASDINAVPWKEAEVKIPSLIITNPPVLTPDTGIKL